MTGKGFLPKTDFQEKTFAWKKFEYSPLGNELKAQTDIAKKQYQKCDKIFEFDKIIKREKPTLKNLIDKI